MTARRPKLEKIVHGHSDYVTDVYYVIDKNLFITTSEDTTLRIWKKRDNGDFWPSVWRTFDSSCTCMWFEEETREIFVGLHSGEIVHLQATPEYDKLDVLASYKAHKNRVTSIIYSKGDSFLLSCSRDKIFQLHSTETQSAIDRFTAPSWISCMEFDFETKHGFVGTYNGDIVVLKCSTSGVKLLQVLSAHADNVKCLTWDAEQQRLFSGGADKRVVIWDFGTRQGISYELNIHTKPLTSLIFLPYENELLSLANDDTLVTWDLDSTRIEARDWTESNTCELCGVAFFWAFKISLNANRQHHCRKCGKAVCASCAPNKVAYPIAGYELPVIICKECYPDLTAEERVPTASKVPLNGMTLLKYDQKAKMFLGANKDYSFRFYKMAS